MLNGAGEVFSIVFHKKNWLCPLSYRYRWAYFGNQDTAMLVPFLNGFFFCEFEFWTWSLSKVGRSVQIHDRNVLHEYMGNMLCFIELQASRAHSLVLVSAFYTRDEVPLCLCVPLSGTNAERLECIPEKLNNAHSLSTPADSSMKCRWGSTLGVYFSFPLVSCAILYSRRDRWTPFFLRRREFCLLKFRHCLDVY